jgi:hypothetical protein
MYNKLRRVPVFDTSPLDLLMEDPVAMGNIRDWYYRQPQLKTYAKTAMDIWFAPSSL